MVGKDLQRVVFLSVVEAPWEDTHNQIRLAALRAEREHELQRYQSLARGHGLAAEYEIALDADVARGLEALALQVAARYPNAVFVAGQVVFQRPSVTTRFLHNEIAFSLQRRLLPRGSNMIILPVRLPHEVWPANAPE